MSASNYGAWVRERREKIGMDRAVLAQLARISRTYLWQIETTDAVPSQEIRDRIEAALRGENGVAVELPPLVINGNEPIVLTLRIQIQVVSENEGHHS